MQYFESLQACTDACGGYSMFFHDHDGRSRYSAIFDAVGAPKIRMLNLEVLKGNAFDLFILLLLQFQHTYVS